MFEYALNVLLLRDELTNVIMRPWVMLPVFFMGLGAVLAAAGSVWFRRKWGDEQFAEFSKYVAFMFTGTFMAAFAVTALGHGMDAALLRDLAQDDVACVRVVEGGFGRRVIEIEGRGQTGVAFVLGKERAVENQVRVVRVPVSRVDRVNALLRLEGGDLVSLPSCTGA